MAKQYSFDQLREREALFEEFFEQLEKESSQAAGWMGHLVMELQVRFKTLGPKKALEAACILLLTDGKKQKGRRSERDNDLSKQTREHHLRKTFLRSK